MPVIKPKFDGSEMLSNFYDGPPPTPGTYHGVIRKFGEAKIGSGDNKGEDRLVVVVDIDSGKFKGASIVHSLNVLTSSAWAINQFLDALTDGSEKQKVALRKLFWTKGYSVEAEPDGKLGRQILSIGGKFKPIGKGISFVTEIVPSQRNGQDMAQIARFLVPLEGGGAEDPEEPEESALDADSSAAEEETVEEEPTAEATADDDDDPWGDD